MFQNPPDIGGRYSALSFFGLVPAALMGIDVGKLLDRAEEMAKACAAEVSAENNPGEWLGVILATLAQKGRDKITFITSKEIAPFGAWAEQLIAESTGKEGKGLVPIDAEPLGKSSVYGIDRVFVYACLQDEKNPTIEKRLNELQKVGHPIIRLTLRDPYDISAEFFRWEFAIAVAGALLGIDAFDQPNVEEAKVYARHTLEQSSVDGGRWTIKPVWENKQFAVYATEKISAKNLRGALKAFFNLAQPNDYLALMAYLQNTPGNNAALKSMRVVARDSLKLATTAGYGPRFLHSTGQLHKGGANNILALQITADNTVDAAVAGEAYTFGKLIHAQSFGDWQALEKNGRRALRVHLKRGASLQMMAKEMQAALGKKPVAKKTTSAKLEA